MHKTKLESERLIYVPITDNSLDLLYKLFSDKTLTKYFVSGHDESINDTKKRLIKIVSHWDRYDFGDFIVLSRETQTLIGFGGLHYKRSDGNVNISYIVAEKAQGNGFGFEIASTLLDYGYNQLNLEEITAEIDPDNLHSKSLITKCGFRKRNVLNYQGYEREEYILSKAEYQSNIY